MQLLLWHEALGSDDEQASEEELTARVLYSLDSSDELPPVGGGGREAVASVERLLQSLHFVQGLLAFVRLLRRSRTAAQAPPAWTQEWISVTLSRRRFFVLEVEPLVFLALKDHRHAYEALLRDVYRLFRLFHGSIDRNLRLLPSVSSRPVTTATGDEKETESIPPHVKTHVDGMELLLDIQTTRKRLRKLRLVIDAHTHNHPLDSSSQDEEGGDTVVGRLEAEQQTVEAELQALVARSPAPQLQRKCVNFFPTLLQALDAGGASSFSELQGLGYFPMDQPLFLALQSFVNNLHTELKPTEAGAEIAETSALFFKGNLLWSSMEISTMHLLYKFLRLREERGMELSGCGNQQSERSGARPPAATEHTSALWMEDAYEDTFLPVWSSKLSYTDASTQQDLTGSAPEGPTMAILQRLEAHLDKQQQFQMLAQRIFTRYHATFAPDMRYLHSLPPFLYLNRVNLAFKMQHVPRLLKTKEDELFPLPTRLLAHYLPASTLALVNELHAELQAATSAGNRELCVRTRHAGWVLAKKSRTSRRELYVLFDPKVSSVLDLSGAPPPIHPSDRLAAHSPIASAMGKIIDSVLSAYRAPEDDRPTISFEFFPAKTNAGVFNLLTRVEEMGLALQPTFVTLTWRSAFTDEQLWLRIGAHIQNEFQLDVLLHLTCHLPTQQLKQILHKARAAGIRNILALRGDPPIGADRWTPVEGGLSNAVDLIKLIRQEHGDFFCIACAGYAEVHTEAWNHPELPPSNEARALDLQRLRAKQDAGADFIITQFFFDVDNMVQWIADCKAAGISIPILPGYLPIQNYSSFCKFTSWCKTRVPADVLSALDAIKNDDAAVRRYGTQLAVDTCRRLLAAGVRSLHFYTMNLAATVTQVMEGLELLPARNQRDLPWQSTLQRSTAEGEQVRPIFWSNRQASYIARTAAWDEFPNGRWGDRTSPAYGDLSEYYLAFKRPKLKRADLWGTPQTEQDVWSVFVRFIDGHVKQLPWCEQALSLESAAIRENLQWLNANGFLTINSQPRVNGAPSSDLSVGWGGTNGVVFQKAYVEFFVAPEKLAHLVTVMRRDYPQLSFHALNRQGDEHRNTPLHSVTAVTWGVFPGTEIVQPTVVDSDSFAAWKDEAFELWQTQWASAYPADSQAREVVQHIHDSYFLVNIVDNDYANDDSDIFSIFTRIITEAMDKEHLRARVLQLEARREKMFETLASFQALQEELGGELRAAHSELASARNTNLQLKEKVRQLQAQLALATL
ncbi:hypothetical protein BBJ28_00022147 [Nothophytophthora sp. Chile5]|nr:hypothetical protein BBJ28_00022147 [Nothophytophthora sp. Chile5]